jgi:hypothetical protein
MYRDHCIVGGEDGDVGAGDGASAGVVHLGPDALDQIQHTHPKEPVRQQAQFTLNLKWPRQKERRIASLNIC